MAKVTLTAGRVAAFRCPVDRPQAFLWDVSALGLGIRATPAGKPSYVFQSRYQDKTVRITIGGPEAWSIPDAREKARELQRLIDEGNDPRDLKRDALAAAESRQAAAIAQAKADTLAAAKAHDAWTAYLAERRPHWGDRHHADHLQLSRAGGEPAKRGTDGRGVTIAGPLHALLAMPLRDLTSPVIEAWAAREAQTRPTQARLALRLLRAFLNWCAEQPGYTPLLPERNAATSRKTREALGRAKPKDDALLREQLPAWFAAVRDIQNPVIAAYLQTLLLTGARPGEVLALRWEDLNTKWRGITIRDKVEGMRVIPLTAYVAHLLAGLPRRNEWVFSSATANGGTLSIPRNPHLDACAAAGIDGLTLHGLRRSFGSLSEWLEIPAGVVAQVMGHKPSATAEKHYRVRPLDLLRVHHERIEAWMLEQAGVTFDRTAEPGKLRMVQG